MSDNKFNWDDFETEKQSDGFNWDEFETQNEPVKESQIETPSLVAPISLEASRQLVEKLPTTLGSLSKKAMNAADKAAYAKFEKTAPKQAKNILKQDLGIGPGIVESSDVGKYLREKELIVPDVSFFGGVDQGQLEKQIKSAELGKEEKLKNIKDFLDKIQGKTSPLEVTEKSREFYKQSVPQSKISDDAALTKLGKKVEMAKEGVKEPLTARELHEEKGLLKKDVDYEKLSDLEKIESKALDNQIVDLIKQEPDGAKLVDEYKKLKKEYGTARAAQLLIEERALKGDKLGALERVALGGTVFEPGTAGLFTASRLNKMYGDVLKTKAYEKLAKGAKYISEIPGLKTAAEYAGKPLAKSIPLAGMALSAADLRAAGATPVETTLGTAAGEIPGFDFLPVEQQLQLIRSMTQPKNLEEFSPEETTSGALRPYGFADGGVANILGEYNAQKQATEAAKPKDADLSAAQEEFVKQQTPALKRQTSESGKGFIKSQEGFSAKPKWDYKQTSYGYGNKYEPGMPSKLNEEQADQLFRQKIGTYEEMANKLVGDKPVPQDTYDAIVSYLYNTGTGALRLKTGEESDFAKYAQAGDWDNAINEMDIVTAGGKRLPGLEKRRRMERDLARKGLYSQLRNKLALK